MFIKKIKPTVFLSSILLVLIGLLFRESFGGMILQGVDDNASMRAVIVRSLLSGQGYHFIPNYWLGFIFNVPNPDLYNTILAITGNIRVVGVYVVALFLSGIVTFKLIKRQGVSDLSAIFGAVSYTFLPHVLSLVYSGHALAVEAIPMTPGFLLCLSVLLEEDDKKLKILSAFWAGIFWAWMMIGEPQRGVYGTVLGMAWVVYLLVQQKDIDFKKLFSKEFITKGSFKNKILYLFVVVVVGLGIFLSTIKFWANSEFLNNEGSWEFATSWSFPPMELMDSFAFGYHGLSSSEQNFPYFGDKPMSGNSDSLGFFLMVFMIMGVSLLWKSRKKSLRFFAISGLVALILSFGKYFPVLFGIWYHIPGMDTMRVPAKFLSITGLSWAIVAAYGLDIFREIFESDNSDNKKLKKNILMVLGVVTVVSVLWFVTLSVTGDATSIRAVLGRANRTMVNAALSLRINGLLDMSLLFGVLLGLATMCYFKPKFVPYFPLIIIALSCYNVYQVNRFYISRTYVNEEQFYPKTELIDFLQKNLGLEYRASGSLYLPNVTGSPNPMGAVIEQALYPLNNNDLTYSFPYYDINMFGRIPISRLDDGYLNFFKSSFDSISMFEQNSDVWEMNKRLWYMGNVKYIIVGDEIHNIFANELQQDTIFITNVVGSYDQRVSIYELKNKLPRFALIKNVTALNEAYMYGQLTESLKFIEHFTLPIQDAGYNVLENQVIQPPVPVVPTRLNYNSYQLAINNPEDTVLYFGDLFDEGWNATVDGVDMPLHRANGIQQYLYLPANSKEVLLTYDRPVKGLLFSRIFIILSIVFALFIGIKSFTKKTS